MDKAWDDIKKSQKAVEAARTALKKAQRLGTSSTEEIAKLTYELEQRYYDRKLAYADLIKHIARGLVYFFAFGLGCLTFVNSIANIAGGPLISASLQAMFFLIEEATIYSIELFIGILKFYYAKQQLKLAESRTYINEKDGDLLYYENRVEKRWDKLEEYALAFFGVALFIFGDIVEYIPQLTYWGQKIFQIIGFLATTAIVYADRWFYKLNIGNHENKQSVNTNIKENIHEKREEFYDNTSQLNTQTTKTALSVLVAETGKLAELNMQETLIPNENIKAIEREISGEQKLEDLLLQDAQIMDENVFLRFLEDNKENLSPQKTTIAHNVNTFFRGHNPNNSDDTIPAIQNSMTPESYMYT